MEKLRVVIAEKDSLFRKSLTDMLTKEGYIVVGEAGDGMTALKKVRSLQPEILLASPDLPVMDGIELAEIVEESKMSAVVLVVDYGGKDLLKGHKWHGPVLVKPFEEFQLLSILDYSYAAFNKMVDLQNQISRLKNDLETRKVIEKAKGILMKKHNLSEEAAFKRIQQQSMRNRTSMKKLAQAVILAHEMEE